MSANEQERAEWLQWRRGGIGASDSPAILGVCPHNTRLGVYLDKIGESRPSPRNAALDWGLRLEDDIAEAYELRTGFAIERTQVRLESKIWPWMRATLDGVRADGRPVEMKSLGVHAALEFHAADGDWESLPPNWIVQAHHQMAVAETDACDVAVFYPLDLRIFTVPRDDELVSLIVDLAGELWECVEDRVPPRAVDAIDVENLARAYPRARGEIVLDDDPALLAAADAWMTGRDKAALAVLLDAMGEAASATLDGGRLLLRREIRKTAAYSVPAKTRVVLKIQGAPRCA